MTSGVPAQVPIEILRIAARATGAASPEAYADRLAVEPAPETRSAERELREAREQLSRQRRRALERAAEKERLQRETAARDAARRAAFAATSRKRKCELLPNDVPATGRQIVWRTMRGARAAERELLSIRRRFPTFARMVALSAFGTAATSERGRRRGVHGALKSIRARRVVACAAAMAYLWQVTQSPGRTFLVEGTLRGTLCSLFQNAEGDAVHHNTLFSTMTDGERRGRWDCGAVVALQRSGAIEKLQPPAHTQRARFVGRDRHGNARALNQYFVRDDVVAGDVAGVEARALSAWELWLSRRPVRAARRAEVRGPPAAVHV